MAGRWQGGRTEAGSISGAVMLPLSNCQSAREPENVHLLLAFAGQLFLWLRGSFKHR